ncbi:MAG: hypothetical protein HN411_01280 [Waddliaceae bacterium]|jgi:hypothetical protein|nr:hypothetical protein [Waddliaceae bacterium]MBT3579614.1 hypothetical protein [Waddliaceae bacterium]MBT4445212.1 hypothetical protein [Waddliaceae bacterium]MBT6928141.1 hypothetical protein [Waddliaceae bacterium]MBT7264209.1 hypothetical protein [Waddliaceae bacterium]
MTKIRRHNSTLLEVIIAMALSTMLMTTLLGYYWHTSKTNNILSQQRREATTIRYLQQRLSYVIENATIDTKTRPQEKDEDNKKRLSCFFSTKYSGNDSLVFTFDNGVADSDFSNGVLARLYLEDDSFMLATWTQPHENEISSDTSTIRKEVLLRGVADIHFSFFSPPTIESFSAIYTKPHTEGRGIPEPYPGKWHTTGAANNGNEIFGGWERKYGFLPPLVKIYITMENPPETLPKTIVLTFQVSEAAKKPVIYWET